MAQMGEMIGAIAHQWRQPLNSISTSIQNLKYDYKDGYLEDEQFIKDFIDKNKKTIKFMSKTIDDFRNFFKEEREGANFCINDVITHILSITQTGFENNGIKLTFDTKKVFYSYGYPNELGQAILNIINNARDALSELQQENKYIHLSLSKKEDMVSILIEDNAGGIPEKLKDKIFDPYFSTKKDKNGTGLGLYMTKMIITEKQNGKIHFTNTEKGVIFEIKLKEVNNAT
jgi:signal transduction histidine kinase